MDMLDQLLWEARLIGKIQLLEKQNKQIGKRLDKLKKRYDKLGN